MGKKNIFLGIIISFFCVFNLFCQIPNGYYTSAFGKTGDSLRKALSIITANGHVKLTYTPGVWNAYAFTDVRPNDTTKIWDMYSDIPNGTPPYLFTIFVNQSTGGVTAEGMAYAREHSFPNSWWGGIDNSTNPQYTDLHHLFPSDQFVNQKKSNNPIGVTNAPNAWVSLNGSKMGTCTFPGYNGNVFEPIDEYKGDFARAFFYIATRYYGKFNLWVRQIPSTSSALPIAMAVLDTTANNYKQWFINLLLSWHNADPVSQKEINRNNAVYYKSGQNNRNPFIDYPEFVSYIWGNQLIKPEPTFHASNFQVNTAQTNSATLTLTWTDSYGTTSPDGYLIKAFPGNPENIQPPKDSIPETNSLHVKNVVQGTQAVSFTGLIPDTVYSFKIFPYTNSGVNINYKTDGVIPTITTSTPIWKEDFEIGTKTAYAIGSVNCTMGSWTLNDALLGTLIQDKKNGLKSIRGAAFIIYMNFDKQGGAGNITINAARYGNDTNYIALWRVEKSVNAGQTWVIIKDSITTANNILQPITIPVNEPNPVRFAFVSYNGSQTNKRLNIDDVIISNYLPPLKKLKLKIYLEGFYENGFNKSVQNETGNQWANGICDYLTVILRDTTPPFNTVYIKTNVALMNNGDAIIDSLPRSLNNQKYYLVIKHRNHLETWSSQPISIINDEVNYDFSSSINKSYGETLKQVGVGKYAIRVGDVNQDGVVDISDLVEMDADLINGTVGYVNNDINGDGVVDLSDLVTIDENLTIGASTVTP